MTLGHLLFSLIVFVVLPFITIRYIVIKKCVDCQPEVMAFFSAAILWAVYMLFVVVL